MSLTNREWAEQNLGWPSRAWISVLDVASPKRAVFARHFARMDRDAEYRQRVDEVMESRGYENAHSSTTSTPWLSSGWGPRSADAEILGDLPKLRNRSRELGRDDAIGKGIKRKKVDGYVGPGIDDRAATGNDAKDDAIDAVWKELREKIFPAENCGWFEGQRLIAARLHEDGEVWTKRSKAAAREPLFIEIVEADRVDTPLDVRKLIADPKGSVRLGVERDEFGRVLAWWICKYHPGDQVLVGTIGLPIKVPTQAAKDFSRVQTGDAVHLRLFDRAGQSRGVPECTPVLQDIRDLDLFVLAVLKRLQVAAMFATFIESPEALDDVVDATREKYGYRLKQDLHPGMMFLLHPGEKISTVNPNFPIPDVEALNKIIARRIGAGTGLGWQSFFYDFSEANYSSARMDRLEAEAAERSPQQQCMATFRWIRRVVLEDALLRGEPRLMAVNVQVADLDKVTQFPRPKPSVDPEKDAKADALDLALGKTTLQILLAERGLDWQEVLIQRAKEKAALEQLGLEFLLAPQAPGAGAEQKDDEEPKPKAKRTASTLDVVHVNGRIGRFLAEEKRQRELIRG